MKGVDSEAAREIAAFAGTVTSCSDFDVASTAFSPLWTENSGQYVAGASCIGGRNRKQKQNFTKYKKIRQL